MPRVEGSPPGSGYARNWAALALGVILLAALLRLVRLDADPLYPLWAGYVTDEGRWTEQARRLVLFHAALPESRLAWMHLMLAPLYQAATLIPFVALGPGFVSARLVSAVCSITLLFAVFSFLRPRFTPTATVLVLIVLGLQPDLLFLGRIAIPEMAAMLFSFLAFAALVAAGASRRRLFVAGLLTAVAGGVKATTAPLVPVFAAIIPALSVGRRKKGVLRSLTAYLSGVIAPGLVLLPILLAVGGGRTLQQLGGGWQQILGFVRLGSPYPAVAQLLYGEVAAAMGVFLLAGWLVAGLLLVVGRLPEGAARDVYLGSAIWAIGWFSASALLDYFPDRYVLHVIVPLALNLGAGMTMLRQLGSEQIREALRHQDGWRHRAAVAWLCLPLAVLLAPTIIAAAGIVGVELNRLRHHLALTLAIESMLVVAWLSGWVQRHALSLLVALPLAIVALRVPVVAVGELSRGLWRPTGIQDLAVWCGVLVFAAGFVALTESREVGAPRAATGIFVVILVGAWLSRVVPSLADPSYTIRDAAAIVESMASGEDRVGTVSASGVLLGTSLPYVEDLSQPPLPQLLITAFNPLHPSIAGRYRLEQRIDLDLGETFEANDRVDTELQVYRLKDPAPMRPPASSAPEG